MQRFKSALFVTCLGAALLGCGDGEQRKWLEQRQRRLDLELAEKVEIAQNLNERRIEVQRLDGELGELQVRLRRPSTEELSKHLAGPGLDTLTVREEQGVLSISLGGTGRTPRLMEALRALSTWERGLALKRVVVEHRRWAAELEAPAVPTLESRPVSKEKSPKVLADSRAAMPKASLVESLVEGDELARRKRQIEQTEQRLTELNKVLGEVLTLNHRKGELQAQVDALKAPNPRERLVGQRPLVEALFGGRKPRLRFGVAEFQGPRLTLTGLGMGDAAKRLAALSEVGPVLQSDADTVVLSTASVP